MANGVRGDGAGTAVHRTSPGLDRVRPCRRSSPGTRSSTRRTASRHGPSGSMPTTRLPTPAMRDAAGTVTSVPAPGRKKEAPPDHSDDVTGPRAGSGHGVRIRPPVGQGRDGADPVPNGGSDPNGVAGGGSATGATPEGPAKCQGSQEWRTEGPARIRAGEGRFRIPLPEHARRPGFPALRGTRPIPEHNRESQPTPPPRSGRCSGSRSVGGSDRAGTRRSLPRAPFLCTPARKFAPTRGRTSFC